MMPRFSVRTIVPLALVLAVSAAACSKGNSASPVAPTSTSASSTAAPAPISSGASIKGVVVTGTPSALSGLFNMAGLGSAGRVTVTVNGTSITVISDDNGSFTLENVPPGNLNLTITGSGFSAQVTIPGVGSSEQITVTIRVTGSTATVDDSTRESANSQAEVEGVINSVAGGTIIVGRLNTPVVVPPTATITKVGGPGTIADLVPGARIEAKGTKSGETLTATSIVIESSPASNTGTTGSTDSDDGDNNETKVNGTVVATPVGTCPTVSFMVGTTKVTTNASTKFDDVTCATLAAGDSVSIEGTTQTDGSLLASEIEKEDDSSDDGGGGGKNSVSGSISGFAGSCPALTFTVSGTKVTTNNSTKFSGINCSSLANGKQVDVRGTKQPDNSIVATDVSRDD